MRLGHFMESFTDLGGDLKANPRLADGLNVHDGKVTYEAVARDLGVTEQDVTEKPCSVSRRDKVASVNRTRWRGGPPTLESNLSYADRYHPA